MNINKSLEKSIINMETECPEDFKKLDWTSLSSFKHLSEDFIAKYIHLVNISVICTHQNLSESFLRAFDKKINFKVISITQVNHVSIDFLCDYRDNLNWDIILINKQYLKQKNILSYKYKYFLHFFEEISNKTRIHDDHIITLSNILINKSNQIVESSWKTQECIF